MAGIKCKILWPGWSVNVSSNSLVQENFVYSNNLSGAPEITPRDYKIKDYKIVGRFKGKPTKMFACVVIELSNTIPSMRVHHPHSVQRV